MKTLIAFVVVGLALVALLAFSPAFAASVASAAPDGSLHIDFTPLIPVINGMITAIAGILTASTPVIAYYIVIWLRNHGIAVSQAGQKVIADRLSTTIQNGLKYATSGADAGISKLTVDAPTPAIASAANYAILQSPDLLKKAGIDVTTTEGQQTLVRRITAESMPTPAAQTPALDVHLDTGAKPDAGKG